MVNKIQFFIVFLLLLSSGISSSQNTDSTDLKEEARVLYAEGRMLNSNGEYVDALNTFSRALSIRKKVYGPNHISLGQIYIGIGVSYRSLGNNDLALNAYLKAEEIYLAESSEITEGLATLYQNIGLTYRDKLDFTNALRYFQESLNFQLSRKNIDLKELARYEANIAELHYVSNNYDEALKIIHKYKDVAPVWNRILFYELLSYIYIEQENYKEAATSYNKVISISEKLYEKNSLSLAYSYTNMGLLLIYLNDFNGASAYLAKSYSILEKQQPDFGVYLAEYYRVMGFLTTKQPINTSEKNQFNKQLIQKTLKEIEYYSKGLSALLYPTDLPLDSIQNLENVISLTACIDFLKLIGESYVSLSEIENSSDKEQNLSALFNALDNFQKVAALIQKARRELLSDESKIQLSELENSTFHSLVQVSQKLYAVTNKYEYLQIAFHAAEQSKSSAVFDKISADLALENSLVPDSLIDQEKLLNSTIAFYKEKIYEEKNKSSVDSSIIRDFGSKVFEAESKKEKLNEYIENNYPDYYELKYSDSRLTIKDVQNKISENQILIEYVYTEETEDDNTPKLFCFVIGKDTVQFENIQVGKNFSDNIKSMFYFMSNKDFLNSTNTESVQFCVTSNFLYNKLIQPFNTQLKNKKVTIIPDGKLNYIAFDALLENLPDTTKNIQFNKLDYLIKTYQIGYSNSANLLFKTASQQTRFRVKTVAFAPEYYNDTFEIATNTRLLLVPLPGVQREVENLSRTMKTTIFKGGDASESNFREHAENYDILHLAMHAFINDSLPRFSRLAFYQNKKTENISEGWVNTADIYNLNLTAKLTVLSACNTGVGQLKKGEGIMSLARGFQYAGCPSIIMSLWEVEDIAGTQIMSSFYKYFKSGKSKSEALREAKLDYLKTANSRHAHPHYWLSFMSIGDDSPLFKSYDFYFFILLVIALSGIAIDQILRMKKARKKQAS